MPLFPEIIFAKNARLKRANPTTFEGRGSMVNPVGSVFFEFS